MADKSYNYNGRWPWILGAGILFLVCAVVFAQRAATNNHGIIIKSAITFGPDGATKYYWCLTVCSLLMVLLSIVSAMRRILNPKMVVLDATGIWIPHGLFQTSLARVQYSDILQISEIDLKWFSSLEVKTPDKTYSIMEILLPNQREYNDLKAAIASSMPKRNTG